MTAPPPNLKSALAAVTTMYTNDVGGRLKKIEDSFDAAPVSPESPFVVRIDGVAFSTFTHGIVKPFDFRLKDALVNTTLDLAAKFQPLLAFHHSDEISLLYPAANPLPSDTYDDNGVLVTPDTNPPAEDPSKKRRKVNTKVHMYSGRIQKLASVISSYAAARFNYHLATYDWSDLSDKVRARMMGHEAYFDGRVVPVPDLKTAMECIYWRSNFDGFRNSVSGIAQHHFTHKELHSKNLTHLLDMLATKNVDVFETYGPKYLFGTWIKKETYHITQRELDLPPEALALAKQKGSLDTPIVRKRYRAGCFNWAEYTEEERLQFVASKFWPEGERAPPKGEITAGSLRKESE
ncbi:hypothetical protein BCR33DRAFT_719544 [Rhizoclosmatium globosum]|uniref:tRNA(His) guanylyltransferase n=1 Tax=Rhizoclosmatium globosum TaxID=329046 RepID=A0A1Y2BZF1_9FUNG|nr:hypothetical protein BCR33DRAFT_719544 [Rhizoclosmatium globosum]|eukprot:ORY40140.1 hypothetical protein BCR33DRAFT_719544 [Rhizoclosmatium globosum]